MEYAPTRPIPSTPPPSQTRSIRFDCSHSATMRAISLCTTAPGPSPSALPAGTGAGASMLPTPGCCWLITRPRSSSTGAVAPARPATAGYWLITRLCSLSPMACVAAPDRLDERRGPPRHPWKPAGVDEAHALIKIALARLVGDKRAGDPAGAHDLLDRRVDRRLHLGMRGVAGVAHRLRQIRWRHVEHVDLLDGKDLGQIMQRLELFDQNNYERLVVRAPVIVGHAVRAPAGIHAAPADRPELRRLHHALGLLPGRNVGHDDAAGASVERAGDQPRLVGSDSDDRGHAPQIAGAREVADLLPAHRPMLALDPHAVEAELAKIVDHVHIVQPADHAHHLAGVQLSPDADLSLHQPCTSRPPRVACRARRGKRHTPGRERPGGKRGHGGEAAFPRFCPYLNRPVGAAPTRMVTRCLPARILPVPQEYLCRRVRLNYPGWRGEPCDLTGVCDQRM